MIARFVRFVSGVAEHGVCLLHIVPNPSRQVVANIVVLIVNGVEEYPIFEPSPAAGFQRADDDGKILNRGHCRELSISL